MPVSFGRRLGTRLRALREARGWTQEHLAQRAELSANYVGMLERGAKLPTIDTLVSLAKVLGANPGDLLGDAKVTDAWLDEMIAVASTVPAGQRSVALAVLRAIAGAKAERRP